MNKKILTTTVIVAMLMVGLYLLKFDKTSDTVIPLETGSGPITSGENPQPGSTVHDLPVEPAASVVRKDLATKLYVEEKSIVILKITETTWNDGCLGLGGPAESCLQALVPGFRIELLAKGNTYFYRTDRTGASFRAEIQ